MNQEEKNPSETLSREEMQSALFANMVLQQTNMAMMFMGKIPHPETNERVNDLEMAQMFIDQLEMLEAKTRNNLDQKEQSLLKQSLTAVRMAFVDAVNQNPGTGASTKREAELQSPAASSSIEGSMATAESEESHKKFSKKY